MESGRPRFLLFPLQRSLRAFLFPLTHPWIVLPLTMVKKKKRKPRGVRVLLSAFTDYVEKIEPAISEFVVRSSRKYSPPFTSGLLLTI